MKGYDIYNSRTCPATIAGHSIKETYEFYFKSEKSNLRYTIEATYHEGNFFAVKFYCKAHKLSKNKYSLQTFTNEPFKIMWTCTQVIPKLMEKYPECSFVALGARSIEENRIEDAMDTMRFQMYKRHVFNQFGDKFVILDVPENSGIALINIEKHLTEYDEKKFTKDILRNVLKIKEIIRVCYDNIHIPD